MKNLDIMKQENRLKIIQDIQTEENKRRKADSFRRLDIYKKNQKKYIEARILRELSSETLANMRTVTSINFCQKVIDAKASIYKKKPTRNFMNATDDEKEQLNDLYKFAMADVRLKKSNRYFKLEDQITIQVVPKDGGPQIKVLCPHHFDVVPDNNNPEKAFCYILSGFDKYEALKDVQSAQALDNKSRDMTTLQSGFQDRRNEVTGDQDDYMGGLGRYVWWTDDLHFMTDDKGNILDENNKPYLGPIPQEKVMNPIGVMPFIDVVTERDYEYWSQTGSNITDFQIDLGAKLSDDTDINFRQGYSQAIIKATEMPKSMQTGPHTVLFLKIDPKADAGTQPEFEFATPTPDLGNSIKLTEMLLAMELTSEGLDANLVSTTATGSGKTYSSGFERLLAQIEEFSASEDDVEMFHMVEERLFELLRLWNNSLQNVRGDVELDESLRGVVISDNVKLSVNFYRPSMIQNETEKEQSVITRMDAGLMSRKMAIMKLYEVDEERAEEIMEEIDEDRDADFKIVDSKDDVDEQSVDKKDGGAE